MINQTREQQNLSDQTQNLNLTAEDMGRIPGVQDVRISPNYDENKVPLVRLTRSVQTGFGIGVGIMLAALVAAAAGFVGTAFLGILVSL